jgi:hypothetical protein
MPFRYIRGEKGDAEMPKGMREHLYEGLDADFGDLL